MVENELEGLLLAHDNSLLLGGLVLEDAHISSSSLLPDVGANLITILILSKEQEESGAPANQSLPLECLLVVDHLLVLLSGASLHLLDHLIGELELGVLHSLAIGGIFNIFGHFEINGQGIIECEKRMAGGRFIRYSKIVWKSGIPPFGGRFTKRNFSLVIQLFRE